VLQAGTAENVPLIGRNDAPGREYIPMYLYLMLEALTFILQNLEIPDAIKTFIDLVDRVTMQIYWVPPILE